MTDSDGHRSEQPSASTRPMSGLNSGERGSTSDGNTAFAPVAGGLYVSRKRVPWWAWIAGIDLVLLAITAADRIRPDWPYVWRVIDIAPLWGEMNLGAWWSGMSLFAAALICYELSASKDPALRWAWLGMAFMLALLSLDEIGSIHERLDLERNLRRFVFAAGVLAIIPLYVVVKLFRHPETKTASVLICIAYGLLFSVAGQERIQHIIDWSRFPDWIRALRVVVEEGTELLATLLILAAVVTQRRGLRRKPLEALVADLRNAPSAVVPVLVGLALTLAICLIALPYLTAIPMSASSAVWYPAVLNVMLFSTAYWIGRDSAQGMRVAWQLIAAGFLFSSATLMTDLSMLLPMTPPHMMPDLWSRLLVLYGWQTLLIVWMVRQKYLAAAHGAITALAVALLALHFYLAAHEMLLLLLYSVFACTVGLAFWGAATTTRPQVLHYSPHARDEFSESAGGRPAWALTEV